jgi:hypothetical protein
MYPPAAPIKVSDGDLLVMHLGALPATNPPFWEFQRTTAELMSEKAA